MPSIHKTALCFLLLFIAALPTDGVVDTAGLPLVRLLGLLAFAFTGLYIITGGAIRGSYFLLFCLFYSLWSIFSFLWTPMTVDYEISQAINSQQQLRVNLYLLFSTLLVFQLIRYEHELQAFMLAFMLGSACLALVFLHEYDPSVLTVRHQVKGADSNEVTVQLATALPLAAYLLGWGKHWLMRLCALAYIPLALFAIMATGSRTGLILLLLATLAFLPLAFRASTWIKFSIPLLLAAALAFTVQNMPDRTLERLLSTGQELSSGTLNERSIIWAKAYKEWTKKPVFGHGVGSFRRVVNKHNVDYTAHNSLVSIAVEQGMVGLLAYLAVMLCALFYALKLSSPKRLIMTALLLVICTGQMSLTLYNEFYIWLMYALAVASYYVRHPPDQALPAPPGQYMPPANLHYQKMFL